MANDHGGNASLLFYVYEKASFLIDRSRERERERQREGEGERENAGANIPQVYP